MFESRRHQISCLQYSLNAPRLLSANSEALDTIIAFFCQRADDLRLLNARAFVMRHCGTIELGLDDLAFAVDNGSMTGTPSETSLELRMRR